MLGKTRAGSSECLGISEAECRISGPGVNTVCKEEAE